MVLVGPLLLGVEQSRNPLPTTRGGGSGLGVVRALVIASIAALLFVCRKDTRQSGILSHMREPRDCHVRASVCPKDKATHVPSSRRRILGTDILILCPCAVRGKHQHYNSTTALPVAIILYYWQCFVINIW
jgi:hypothetical protein